MSILPVRFCRSFWVLAPLKQGGVIALFKVCAIKKPVPDVLTFKDGLKALLYITRGATLIHK